MLRLLSCCSGGQWQTRRTRRPLAAHSAHIRTSTGTGSHSHSHSRFSCRRSRRCSELLPLLRHPLLRLADQAVSTAHRIDRDAELAPLAEIYLVSPYDCFCARMHRRDDSIRNVRHLFVAPRLLSCLHTGTHTHMRAHSHSLTHSLARSLTHSLTHSLTCRS